MLERVQGFQTLNNPGIHYHLDGKLLEICGERDMGKESLWKKRNGLTISSGIHSCRMYMVVGHNSF